jgi:hypothetical protein
VGKNALAYCKKESAMRGKGLLIVTISINNPMFSSSLAVEQNALAYFAKKESAMKKKFY